MTDLSRLTDLSRPSPASNARGSASPNIYDRMTSHVERSPQSAAFVATGRHGTRSHTWAEMAEWADRLRGGLRERRVSAGDRIAVSMPNGPDLVAVLLAIVAEGGIAGVLPVPNGRRDGSYVGRSLGVWADCQPTLLIETDSLAERRRSFGALAQLPSATAEQLALSEPVSDCRNPTPEAQPVFLQYTSGSTTRPRGVVVTSEMLAANCEQAARVYGDHARDVVVSWVPLYHDMGLVTAVMRPLYFGYTSVLQEPTEFVADPLSCLRAISAPGGTLSSAPDLAYVHCVRRLSPDDFAGLDLSSWRVARSAGEVVRPETMDAFMALTADAGFSPTSFCPSYGMAEATLTVTTCTPEIRPLRITIDGDLLTAGAAVVERASGRTLLSSGLPLPGTSVQIGGAPAVDGVVGELEVSGPQVAHAYWGAELNRTAEGAARTGDLG